MKTVLHDIHVEELLSALATRLNKARHLHEQQEPRIEALRHLYDLVQRSVDHEHGATYEVTLVRVLEVKP